MARRSIRKNPYELYEFPELIEDYSSARWLLKPEEAVLERLADKLGGFTMLDIGVGGGTDHFSFRRSRHALRGD
jgi:hypothetical protein